jgi:predicted RND superfamily exporter protein
MGTLLAIAIATSVACNLFVLPAILVLADSRGTRTDPIM